MIELYSRRKKLETICELFKNNLKLKIILNSSILKLVMTN